jgi:D-3-phosphoglycerate dehydrogenase
MSVFKVIITDGNFSSYTEEMEILSAAGASVNIFDFKSDDEFPPEVLDADGILLNLYPLGSKKIGQLSQCKVISRYGVGYDNVDVEAATSAGIWVANVPDYCKEEVSDHTLALLLNCLRNISFVHRKIREKNGMLSWASLSPG